MNKQKNIVMIAIAAVALVVVNVGVFMAAQGGAIGPIDNVMLWGCFVVLNVVSILWAASLLGLQPLVVSVSYVAGACLAYLGVRGMTEVNAAEITTAGATYGAFGALAVGNMTAKVRLAFFNKGQVPFIFVILGLLVVDAVLNSQVSNAGAGVFLNAVILPFVLAGATVGGGWSVLNRYGVGRKPADVLAEKDAAEAAEVDKKTSGKKAEDEKLVFRMPKEVAREEAADEEPKAEPVRKTVVAEPVAPAAAAKTEPAKAVEAKPEPKVEEKKEEVFIPLEIDKGESIPEFESFEEEEDLSDLVASMEDDKAGDDYLDFDEDLYKSSAHHEDVLSNILVKQPKVDLAIEKEIAKPIAKEKPPVAKVKPAEEQAPKPAEVKPEPKAESDPKKEQKDDDWLGGHLDLLNKLK